MTTTNVASQNGSTTTNRVSDKINEILGAAPKQYDGTSPSRAANAAVLKSRKEFMALATNLDLASFPLIAVKLNVDKDGAIKVSANGNAGYSYCDKVSVTLSDGRVLKCQVGVNATLIGSGTLSPDQLESIQLQTGGKEYHLAGEVALLKPKLYSTGSVGWFANGKDYIDGRKVQITAQFTVVGSKEWAE